MDGMCALLPLYYPLDVHFIASLKLLRTFILAITQCSLSSSELEFKLWNGHLIIHDSLLYKSCSSYGCLILENMNMWTEQESISFFFS